MDAIFDNPIFVKHVRSRLRKNQVMPSVIIVVVLAMLAMYAGFALGGLEEGVIFVLLYFAQGFILMLLGTNQVAATVAAARDSEILDFHRVSPLRPSTIALGFLLGAPIREYLLVLVLTPFTALCAILGEPGLASYVILLALLWSSSLLFHTLAVLSGLVQVRIKRGNPATALVVLSHMFGWRILGGIAFPAALTVIPALIEQLAPDNMGRWIQFLPKFFGLEWPIWLQSFAYQIPLTAFLFWASVRRMHSAEKPLYSKPQASAFLLTACALILAGLIDPPAQQVQEVARVGAIMTMMLAAVVLVCCVTPEAGAVAIGLRRAERLGERRVSLWSDAAHNGLIAGFLGFIVLAAGEAATMLLPEARFMQADNVHFPPIIGALAVVSFGWAFQFFHLKYKKRGRGYFAVFIFVLWGVPLLLAMILRLQFPAGKIPGQIASISPLAAVPTGTITGLISAAIPALVMGVLLRESVAQFERETLDGEIIEDISAMVELE
jgi:hypothetical protein